MVNVKIQFLSQFLAIMLPLTARHVHIFALIWQNIVLFINTLPSIFAFQLCHLAAHNFTLSHVIAVLYYFFFFLAFPICGFNQNKLALREEVESRKWHKGLAYFNNISWLINLSLRGSETYFEIQMETGVMWGAFVKTRHSWNCLIITTCLLAN